MPISHVADIDRFFPIVDRNDRTIDIQHPFSANLVAFEDRGFAKLLNEIGIRCSDVTLQRGSVHLTPGCFGNLHCSSPLLADSSAIACQAIGRAEARFVFYTMPKR